MNDDERMRMVAYIRDMINKTLDEQSSIESNLLFKRYSGCIGGLYSIMDIFCDKQKLEDIINPKK